MILFVSLFHSILSKLSQIYPSPYPQKATILMCLCLLFGVGLADIIQYSQSDLNFMYTTIFLVHIKYHMGHTHTKYMAHTYNKKLFIVYLKFKFNSLLHFYLPSPATTVWYKYAQYVFIILLHVSYYILTHVMEYLMFCVEPVIERAWMVYVQVKITSWKGESSNTELQK